MTSALRLVPACLSLSLLALGGCRSAPKSGLEQVFTRKNAIAVSQDLELYSAPLATEKVPGEPSMSFVQAGFGLRLAKNSVAGAIKTYAISLWADLDNDGVWQAGEPRARQEGDLGLGSGTMQGILRSKGPLAVNWMLGAEVQHISGTQSRVTAKLTP
jgi:hypothetical protein